MFFLIAIGKLNPGLKTQAELTIKPNTCMKHYYSFLVLSLFVFLSLVCPSPVMAELVSSLKVEAEDGLSIKVINSSNCSPSNMSLNTEEQFGGYSGTGGMISPQSGGEVYLPLVIDYNGVSYGSMTLAFQIRCGNNDNDRTYINFYQECAGNESPDLRISSPGSYYNKYYKKVEYKKVYNGSWYQAYQTRTVNRSFTEGSYLIGLYARDWAIYDYVQIVASAAIIQDGDAEPSCTAPNHVDISGHWDYFGGEDISLTATAYSSAGTESPIADANITGWQWQKWYNDRWNDVTDGTDGDATISGATTKNLQIANCSKNNSGSYQCVVSTGATCSTSGSEVVKVFTLECYNGGTTVYNFTRVGDTQSGTLELELNANTDYEFKFHVDTKFYGHNGHITADATNVVCYEKYNNADAPNITIKTGVEGGTFIIGMEYSTGGNNSNEGEPEISVTYPRKKIYFNPGGSTYWDQGEAQFALYYQRNSGENYGWTDIMSPFTCDGDVYSADIPLWHGVAINCVRLNSSATNNNKASWWTSYKWNQTANITLSASYNKYTITGWGGNEGADCPYSSSTYSPTTYTISFAGNGNSGGSMSNVTAIPCGEDRTLVANGFTKTGHSFTNWIANVDVKINGETVTAGSSISNEATIQDITQNITLTAQWAPKTTSVTLDANTANHGATGSSVTATWGTVLPDFDAATGVSGYALTGYFTDPTGGTKIINADGTLAASTTYTTADSKWNSELSALTLYPQYFYQCHNIITTGAVGSFDSFLKSGGGASYTCSSVADPECHFDHNVFCFSYSNMGGNSSNYYGCRLTSGPAYTPDAAATGFAFWYRTESSSDPVYMEFADKVYKLAATNRAWRYAYVASSRAGSKSGEFDIYINGYKNEFSTTQSSGKIYLSELQATNVTSADPIAPATTHSITVASNNNTYGTVSSTPASGSSVTDCASITVTATPESGCSFVEWKKGDTQVSTEASYTFTMSDLNDGSDLTLTAYFQQDELTISSLPWEGYQDLTGQTVVSADAINSCFDSEITFTFTRDGTVNYYDNNDHETPLGTITSGTAITLNDDLRAHGIYIRCTEGADTLTGVEKTTVGSVYTIWSGSVAVSADYTGVNEAGEEVTLSAEAQDGWLQQVVLGPEHFQTAAVGDTLRVTYTNIENGDAKGAIQTATKYNAIPGNIYKESDGSQVTTNTHDFNLPSSGYYHIITAGSLDSLKNKGIVVKGKGHTITRVSLHASCSNLSLRTTAPDVRIHGADGSIDIMTNKLEFEGKGFNLGNWENKLELDERCFNSVTVGSIINFYMKVEDGATLSFRCNVSSIIADDKQNGKGCPSYGDISFDRTIDDLYGDAPTLIGRIKGYKVLYLLVDADMLRRLKETGMILCGKGTLIKVVEGVPETVVVNPNEERHVPTVVNNLKIYQGGEVTNDEDIEVLGKITYIRHAKGGALSNKLDQWYTFASPFTVSDVEVLDTDGKRYDINAVYY